jgi:glycosyltransferase involved in cell wall biosynthesis
MNVAICATKNRPRLLPLAILSFLQQTAGNKRMIIFDNGESVEHLVKRCIAAFSRMMPILGDVDYCHETIDKAGRPYMHGTAINRACSLAEPDDVLFMWDDDDWSAPERMTQQLTDLTLKDCSLVGYDKLLFYDEARKAGFLYSFGGPGYYAIGTSQCFTYSFWEQNRFKELTVGADTAFSALARSQNKLYSSPALGMMVARSHVRSTCPPKLGSRAFPPCSLDEFPKRFFMECRLVEELAL